MAGRRTGMAALLTILALPAVALAGPSDSLSDPTELRLDSFERPSADEVLPPAPVHTSVCLQLPRYTHLPDVDGVSLLRQLAPTRVPPGSIYMKYEGLHNFVIRRVQSRYRSLWSDQMTLLWEETNITDSEMRRHYQAMGNATGDMIAGGRWWERTWLDSLPAAKGGAPDQPYLRQLGEELNILEWGPLTLDNELHARIDKVAVIGLDPDPGRIYRDLRELRNPDGPARDHAELDRAILDPDRADDESRSRHLGEPILVPFPDLALKVDLPKPKRRFLENTRWSFGLRPRIRVRAPSSLDVVTWVREISLEAEIDVYLGERELKVVSFELQVSYEPEDRELEATFDLALAAW